MLLLVLVALPRLLAVRDGLCHKQLQAVAGPAAVFSHVLPKSMLVLLMLLLSLPLCLPLSRSFSLTGFCILKAISSAFFAFVVFALLRFFPFLCIFCSFNNKRKQKLLLSIFGLFAAVAVVSVVVVVCSGKKMCCQS